jgi:hypothetical protein
MRKPPPPLAAISNGHKNSLHADGKRGKIMAFLANPQNDLPAPWKEKRVIFYAAGLKIYGQIPYILQRQLQGQFISNHGTMRMGGSLWGPSWEDNYTMIPRHRADGKPHAAATLGKLLNWLYGDKGFKFAIADPESGEWQRTDLWMINLWNERPRAFAPGAEETKQIFQKFLGEGNG